MKIISKTASQLEVGDILIEKNGNQLQVKELTYSNVSFCYFRANDGLKYYIEKCKEIKVIPAKLTCML